MEPQNEVVVKSRKAREPKKIDPRLTGKTKTVTLELDAGAAKRLQLHQIETGLERGVVVSLLVLNALPNYWVSTRKTASDGNLDSEIAGREDSTGEDMTISESVTAGKPERAPRSKGQGRGQAA